MRWLTLVAAASGLVLADGGMVAPPGVTIEESGQVAVLAHFDGQEDLLIATGFEASRLDFAWILPAPAEPTVGRAEREFFAELQEYTRPIVRGRGLLGCGGGDGYGPPTLGREGDSLEVREVTSGIMGGYEYLVLEAQAGDTLAGYLLRHGYALPGGADSVFDHYVDKGWRFFTVCRLRDSVAGKQEGNVGIRLTFACDSAVYPMHISRLGSDYWRLTLYVLADHRQEFDGSGLRFSGRVGPGTFGFDPGIISRDCQLTKLRSGSHVFQDIELHRAPDDRPYRWVVYEGDWVYGLVFQGALFGIAFVIIRRRRRS